MVCGLGWFSPLCGYNVSPFNIVLFGVCYILFVAIFILGMWGQQELESGQLLEEKKKMEVVIVDRDKHYSNKK